MEDEANGKGTGGRKRKLPGRLGLRFRKGSRDSSPGVVLLQVDGLSRFQFERAVKAGRMPFVKSLAEGGRFHLCSFYPGQPSSTPAVQAEIMYGKRCAVPAFSFYDAERDEDYRMYGASWAQRIGELASRDAAPLLQGGGSYGNIYSGGAERLRYCGEINTASHWLEEASLFRLTALAVRYPRSAVKVLRLVGVEIVLATVDCVKGVISRGDFLAELKFIGARVGVSVALREAIRYRVCQDLRDGLPIVYANFFGYDEQAHRRGPHSRFAHWSLKGIDGAIRKICRQARKRGGRDYSIIVFSDHGQESVDPYESAFGKSFEKRVEELFGPLGFTVWESGSLSNIMERAKHAMKSAIGLADGQKDVSKRWIRVKAMGPVAHIYLQDGLSDLAKREWAETLVSKAGVDIVLYRDLLGDPVCYFEGEEGDLERLRPAFEKRKHGFTDEVLADLEIMIKSGLSGDLVALGWRKNHKPLSFADERGAHGGPGAEECRGFALLPRQHGREREWIRGLDLRELAFELSGRCPLDTPAIRVHEESHDARMLQLATYNVHGGVGADRRLDPDRIADVTRRLHVDVVCFQEAFESLDGRVSLEAALRRRWREDLHYHFLHLHTRNGFRYGLALACTRPFNLVKACDFRLTEARFARREPRGAQVVELKVGADRICVVNTHFGLNASERLAQAQTLLQESWLGNGLAERPLALAGDFNAGPTSATIRLLRERFRDAQESLPDRRAQASFLSWAPIRRIDHILATPDWTVKGAGAFQGRDAKVASDHLPVFADLKLRKRGAEEG